MISTAATPEPRPALSLASLDDLADLARRRSPGIGPADPVLVGTGVSKLTYALGSIDGDWVIRVSRSYPEPWTWRGGRRHEVALMNRLRSFGVPCADQAMVLEDADGWPVAIMERRVHGQPLTAEQVVRGAPIVKDIAAVIDRVHGVRVDDPMIHAITRDEPAALLRHAALTVDLDRGLRDRVLTVIDRLDERDRIRTLCHRDLRLDHLIVDITGRLTGLIDLGEVGIDDPAVDLALLYGELGREAVIEIVAAMDTADPDLVDAARDVHRLWPLLELLPDGGTWGHPRTARQRLDALV